MRNVKSDAEIKEENRKREVRISRFLFWEGMRSVHFQIWVCRAEPVTPEGHITPPKGAYHAAKRHITRATKSNAYHVPPGTYRFIHKE